MLQNGKKYLVTCDNWFYAPDGENYRAVWGTCILQETKDVFGFTPARPSTNWFIRVGSEEHHVIVAWCQVHFVVRCESRPNSVHAGKHYTDKDTGVKWVEDRIYYAE